ncbi:MAG: HIT family protein [Anaerolineae bacterium]|nr:HIT family protein [Anaerolineae bacterium]
MNACYTCQLIARRDANRASLWDNIYRTHHWDIVHSYDTALPGWLVVVARRHIEALDQLSDAEAAELGVLLRDVSAALKEVTGCLKTYVVQFAEHPRHPHVHFHVIPRMADQPADRRSTKIFGYLGVLPEERIPEAVMNKIAEQVRDILLSR